MCSDASKFRNFPGHLQVAVTLISVNRKSLLLIVFSIFVSISHVRSQKIVNGLYKNNVGSLDSLSSLTILLLGLPKSFSSTAGCGTAAESSSRCRTTSSRPFWTVPPSTLRQRSSNTTSTAGLTAITSGRPSSSQSPETRYSGRSKGLPSDCPCATSTNPRLPSETTNCCNIYVELPKFSLMANTFTDILDGKSSHIPLSLSADGKNS